MDEVWANDVVSIGLLGGEDVCVSYAAAQWMIWCGGRVQEKHLYPESIN